MTAAIEAHGLTRRFGDEVALAGLDLVVEPGEVVALLGPNGAGKTTTVRLLNGVLRPDGGRSSVLGFDSVADADELRHHTGVLTENAGLDDRLTARENLVFTARMRGIAPEVAERRAGELLERFGMGGKADQLSGGFSTGQRKRVALARALLHEPKVLFLDEPTSGLDPTATRDVAALITGLAREQGRTVVVATHFLGEAGKLADKMAILHHGVLHAFGRPDDLARDMWPGFDCVIDLGDEIDEPGRLAVLGVDGVLSAAPHAHGVTIHVGDRDTVARAIARLVGAGHPIFGAESRAPTLEDVYFAIEARVLGDRSGTGRDESPTDALVGGST